MQQVSKDTHPSLYLLADHLDAALAMGEDLTALQGGLTTATALANRIDMLCFGNEMPLFDKKALVGFLQPDPLTTTRARDAFGLALASPAFQWH